MISNLLDILTKYLGYFFESLGKNAFSDDFQILISCLIFIVSLIISYNFIKITSYTFLNTFVGAIILSLVVFVIYLIFKDFVVLLDLMFNGEYYKYTTSLLLIGVVFFTFYILNIYTSEVKTKTTKVSDSDHSRSSGWWYRDSYWGIPYESVEKEIKTYIKKPNKYALLIKLSVIGLCISLFYFFIHRKNDDTNYYNDNNRPFKNANDNKFNKENFSKTFSAPILNLLKSLGSILALILVPVAIISVLFWAFTDSFMVQNLY